MSATVSHTFVVASQAAMLALSANVGDVVVRTDTNDAYVLASPDNWILLVIR